MCSSPKISQPVQKREKRVEYLRNPYLDGAVGQGSTVDQLRKGRSSLRTDMTPTPSPDTRPVKSANATLTTQRRSLPSISGAGTSLARPTLRAGNGMSLTDQRRTAQAVQYGTRSLGISAVRDL